MSLAFAAVDFLHDVPIKSLVSARIRYRKPRHRRQRPAKQLPRPKPPRTARQRLLPLFSKEVDESPAIDLGILKNHVPDAVHPLTETVVPVRESVPIQDPPLQDLHLPIEPEEKLKFSPRNTYEYSHLPPDMIRLLYFRPSPVFAPTRVTFGLLQVRIDDPKCPTYEALSYRWSSTAGWEKVICDGRILVISSNCCRALKRLSKEKPNRLLWVDAICINQRDLAEKNNQLPLMSKIYSTAKRTLAWLGEDKDLGASCLADMESAAQCLSLLQDPEEIQESSHLNRNSIITLIQDARLRPSLALSKLMSRSWFRRVWILQEVALARDVWIYCGGQRASWTAFALVLKLLEQRSKLLPQFRAAWNLVTFRELYQENRAHGGVDIHAAMVQARQCEVTDMRDKIYALLGVCDELARRMGRPQYDNEITIAMVWTRAQRSCLASHLSINALSLIAVGKATRGDLPSWVPDLSDGLRTWPRRPPPPHNKDGLAVITPCKSTNGFCFHPWGTFVDVVSEILGNTESKSIEDHVEQWRYWWKEINRDPRPILSRGRDPMILAFWRTIYYDIRKSMTAGSQLQHWHSCVMPDNLATLHDHHSHITEDDEVCPRIHAKDLIEASSKKVFGKTVSGSMGLFANNARARDHIVLFAGSSIPYLVRPIPRSLKSSELVMKQASACVRLGLSSYQLIGPCYVDGIMSGAEWTKNPPNYREVLLF